MRRALIELMRPALLALAILGCRAGGEGAPDGGSAPPDALAADAGCDGGAGTAALRVGSGLERFVAVEELPGVPLIQGPQGGFHLWLAVRAQGLGPRVGVEFGARDAESGESLTIEGLRLPALDLHPLGCGASEFAGLQGFLAGYDPAAYVGRRALLWAIVTDGESGATAEDEAETTLLDPVPQE